MRTIIIFLLAFLSLDPLTLSGQCPDRVILFNRINDLKNSEIPPKQQLKELYGKVSRLEDCPVKNDTVYVLLLQRIGALNYLEGNFRNAITYTRRSIDIARQNNYTDPAFFIKVYNYLQIFYDSLHLVKDKMTSIDTCLALAIRNNTFTSEVLFNLWQRVSYSYDIGEYERCVNYAVIGESMTQKFSHGNDSAGYIVNFFTYRINALIELKEFETAEAALLKKVSDYKKNKNEMNAGVLYNQLAIIATQKNNYYQSLDYLNQSLKWNENIRHFVGCKQTMNNIGFLYFTRLNDPDMAYQCYIKALGYRNTNQWDNSADAVESLNIYGNIANVQVRKRNFDSARFFFQKAFDQVRPGTNETMLLSSTMDEFTRNSKIQYLTSIIKDKADAHVQQFRETGDTGFLREAIRIYKVADQVVTKVKSEQSEIRSRVAWRSNARNLYEHAIEACLLVNNTEEAFYFFEKSRAVLLNDQLNARKLMTDEQITKEAQVKNKLAILQKNLLNISPAAPEFMEIQKNIFAVSQEQDMLNPHSVNNRLPGFMDTLLVSIYQLKKILRPRSTFLEIFAGDSSVYILTITNAVNSLIKIDKNDFDRLSASFTAYISDPVMLNEHFADFIKTSHKLYTLIFRNNKLQKGHMIISPDGRYFPFEALVTSDNMRSPDYLVKDQAVSYSYSGSYLMQTFDPSPVAQPGFILGIAPVNFPDNLKLASLPGSDGSLKKLLTGFENSNQQIAATATRNNFFREFCRYKIIQLYTHASETGFTGEPVIFFADSALYLSDIIPASKPSTRLIVLSACETGNGRFYRGEGIFSFNRAFAAMGIPSAMVNLWSVENKSTYRLTEIFYKYLGKGLPIDVSLQKAKIEFIENGSRERSLPYYWAATILAGKTDPIELPGSFPWELAIVFTLTVIICILLFLIYRRQHLISIALNKEIP